MNGGGLKMPLLSFGHFGRAKPNIMAEVRTKPKCTVRYNQKDMIRPNKGSLFLVFAVIAILARL